MQCSAFIITLCSLFAFLSFALASPLPVQAIREVRETTIELRARQVPVDHEILHREVSADAESDITLQILAREHKTYEEYVQGMTGQKDTTGDNEDLEPRLCGPRMCI
jgi:hypothetical protein